MTTVLCVLNTVTNSLNGQQAYTSICTGNRVGHLIERAAVIQATVSGDLGLWSSFPSSHSIRKLYLICISWIQDSAILIDYRREGWAQRTESSWKNCSLTSQLSFERHEQEAKQRDVHTGLPGKLKDHLRIRKKNLKTPSSLKLVLKNTSSIDGITPTSNVR